MEDYTLDEAYEVAEQTQDNAMDADDNTTEEVTE